MTSNESSTEPLPEAAKGGGADANESSSPLTRQADLGEQQPPDELVLSFEKLTVYVPGETKRCRGSNACNPAATCLQEYCGMQIQQHDPFYALDGISGYLATGRMCLVLGGTQQSKSTLLRVLSGRSNELDEVSGNVLLNGMPVAKCLQSWRRLCPYISASDTTHSAVLTVRETFEFAAQCTSDGKQTKEEIDGRVNRMLQALALENVGDTVVGDNNLRGVSGGQKRRVTVGEMAIDRKCRYLFCENITDGLSSTDSYQILQKLKLACGKFCYGAMVTLMQPSDEMIELFDTVLVLTTHGEMAYFGPVDREEISKVFASSDNNPESVDGSIADMIEDYRVKPNADALEEAFIRRYNSSDCGKDVVAQLARIRSEAPVAKDRNLDKLLPSTKYSTNGWYQFRILMARRVKLILRNSVTWTRIVIAVVFGVIIGSLFSALDQNVMGALGRTGYLFLNCFLVLMLSAAVTIPSMYRDRVTLFKHRSAEFYSGRIAYATQVLVDTPLSLLEAFLLSTTSYFWVGMRPGANHYFYFLGTLIALECVGQALGRLLCAIFRKQVTANAMSSIVILIFGTVGGFMPSYSQIHPILRWISWLTPVSFAFEGLMINQFLNLTFDDSIIQMANSSVEVFNVGGNQWLSIYNLPRIDFAPDHTVKVFNIFILFLFAIVYDFLGQRLIEKNRSWFFNQTRSPVSTVKESFSMTAPHIVQMMESNNGSADCNDAEGSHDDEKRAHENWPQSLTVKDLCYDVPIKGGVNVFKKARKGFVRLSGHSVGKKPDVSVYEGNEGTLRLLNKVSATFSRGRLCALMGTSGAGKTTLMDVIAGYKTGGSIKGDIYIDGRKKDEKIWKKISGYAEQNDILNPYLTTLETVRFTAECRLSKTKNRQAIIDRVLTLMNLGEWKDVIVGREVDGAGLPKHARKRLTIAIQLVIEPKILFLDEPTTGLSQTAARLVIDSMYQATRAMGLITVATIHQPSKQIWNSFDDILLLVRGGRVAYMGEAGPKSSTILPYFQSLSRGVSASRDCNPADYCLAVLNDTAPTAAETYFLDSDVSKSLSDRIKDQVASPRAPPSMDVKRVNNPFVEIGLLTVRHFVVQWRNPSYCFMRILSSMTMSLYIGILFSGDKSVLSGAVFSIGAIFFLVFVLVIPMQAAVVPLVEDRAVLYRETVSGTYGRFAYGLGQLLADQPFHILNTVIMWIFFYFLVDFRRTAGEMGYFILMLYLSNWVIQSLGQLFALATPNEESANGLGGLSVILSVILMGFLITVDAMPSGWQWAYWANLFHYILQGLVTNELAGNEYFIDIAGFLPASNATEFSLNDTSLFAFGDGITQTSMDQITGFASLAAQTGGGFNPFGNLTDLINCTLTEGCFADSEQSLASAFISCYVFNGILRSPPCEAEFNTVASNVNFTEILRCIDGGDDNSDADLFPEVRGLQDGSKFEQEWDPSEIDRDLQSHQGLSLLLEFVTNATNSDEEDGERLLGFALCLMRALLPPDISDALQNIGAILADLLPIIIGVVEQGGFYLPGEVILFFFSWADFEVNEGFVAPYKWFYCMVAVAIFLGGIELFKLIAIRFIVWTKR